jgi:hypothetical protein
MTAGAKGHGKYARRLREFTAFDNFSDDELGRVVLQHATLRRPRHGR